MIKIDASKKEMPPPCESPARARLFSAGGRTGGHAEKLNVVLAVRQSRAASMSRKSTRKI